MSDVQRWREERREHAERRRAFEAGRLAGLREAAEVVKPIGKRPCDCEPWRCYCEKTEDAATVAAWDHSDGLHTAILALAKP